MSRAGRRCSKCGGSERVLSNGWCNACQLAYYKAKRASESPEQREARLAKRRLKRHGRSHRVHHRRTPGEAKRLENTRALDYYYRHKAQRIAKIKAAREADLDTAREREREIRRRRAPKERAQKIAKRRRTERACADTIAYEAILRGDPCSYCGAPCEHIDHIDPLTAGGGNHWTNLTAACARCNRAKWDKPLLVHFSATGH